MGHCLTVLAADAASEKAWAAELQSALGGTGLRVEPMSAKGCDGEPGQVHFIDAACPDLPGLLERTDRKGRAVFLVVDEDAPVPRALLDGRVDDVLVRPFRALEVMSKVRHYEQILMWDEVTRMNASFSELLERLHDDLRVAERLQKARLPARFPEVKGFKAASRYLAGLRSGGDHFDLADSRDGARLSVLLSDSSSHGLSSAVLSTLMRVAMKLSADEARSTTETVRLIHDELALTLKEKDRLSLFYANISRRDLSLRYLNLGSSRAFHSRGTGSFAELESQADALTKSSGFPKVEERVLSLEPCDRLVLLSDGFVDAAGGTEKARTLLDRFREKEPVDTLNELAFAVKARLAEPDDMPEQDCSAVLLDVDSRVLRLKT